MTPAKRRLLQFPCFSCARPTVKGEEQEDLHVNGVVVTTDRKATSRTSTTATAITIGSSTTATSTESAATQTPSPGATRKSTPWELVSPLGVSATYNPDVLAPLPDEYMEERTSAGPCRWPHAGACQPYMDVVVMAHSLSTWMAYTTDHGVHGRLMGITILDTSLMMISRHALLMHGSK
jgi:hypothetical protein